MCRTDDARRNAGGDERVVQVSVNEGAGADDGPGADGPVRHDGGPHADQCPFPDVDATPEVSAGGDVGVRADAAVVVDGGGGVEDHVAGDRGAGVDDSPSADDHTGAQADVGCQDGGRMDCRDDLLIAVADGVEEAGTDVVIADAGDDAVVVDGLELSDGAQNRDAQDEGTDPGWIVVQETDRYVTSSGFASSQEDVGHDLGVASGTEDQDAHRFNSSVALDPDELPWNFGMVACPSALIPWQLTTRKPVWTRILRSRNRDQLST